MGNFEKARVPGSGTIRDDSFRDTYCAMTQAVNDGHIENNRSFKYVADDMAAEALCWETAFFLLY